MNNNKNKQILFGIIGILILVIAVVGVTFAFFNYTRTGNDNIVQAGRIVFNSTENNTINLENAFPITSTQAQTDTTNAKSLQVRVTGDTSYSKGIEYLITATDVHMTTTTGKTVPVTIEVSVTGNNSKTLGTSDEDYYTNRGGNTSIYKVEYDGDLNNDDHILVGYIAPDNTQTGVDGIINIKAYFNDADILISDTYNNGNAPTDELGTPASLGEGKTVLTTSEWNSLTGANALSFKIKVEAREGTWVEDTRQKLYDVVRTGAVSDSTISNLYEKVGVGNFLRSTTVSDQYPIYYYRGAVENNNVIFANKCWKIVRTTETGGTKLIYNGEINKDYEGLPISDYNITTNTGNFEYNTTTTSWETVLTSNETYEINFTVPAGDNYIIDAYAQTSPSSGGTFTVKKGDNQLYNISNGGGVRIQYKDTIGTLTSSDVIKLTMQGGGVSASAPISISIKVSKTTSAVKSMECDNTGTASQLPTRISFQDTDKYKSPAYVGYNYGKVYESDNQNWTSGALFGSSYSWDGTNYKLVDATVSTPNPTHHYSCNATTADATCLELRYVYYMNGSTKWYITLQNGKGVEDALKEMLSESSDTNKSNIQKVINTWYETYIEDDYDVYVEDTKWCMDRSVTGDNLGGWNPNGGSISGYDSSMYFDVKKRMETASASTPPVLTCSNTNDIMTVKNGKLDYPVALLTYDEAALAGVQWSYANTSSYLQTAGSYWLLSPCESGTATRVGTMSSSNLNYNIVRNTDSGVRPSLSLKHGTLVYDGDGSVSNPYIVGTQE